MNHKTVAQKFAQGAIKANGHNMYVAQPSYHLTIYSYGYHFPIAVRTGIELDGHEIVLFNSDGYSNSTSKHKSHVYHALSQAGFYIVEAPTEVLRSFSQYSFTTDTVNKILNPLKTRAELAIIKRDRARKHKDLYQNQIDNLNYMARVALHLVNGETHEFRSEYPL